MPLPLRNLPIEKPAAPAVPRPAAPHAPKRLLPPPLPPHAQVPVVVELSDADVVLEEEMPATKPSPRTVPRPSGIRLRDERTFGDNDGDKASWMNSSPTPGQGGKPTAAYMIVRKRSAPPPLPPEELVKRTPAAVAADDDAPLSGRGRRY